MKENEGLVINQNNQFNQNIQLYKNKKNDFLFLNLQVRKNVLYYINI